MIMLLIGLLGSAIYGLWSHRNAASDKATSTKATSTKA